MATIPQTIDYGAQPSLRTSRVDVPGSGELAVADAISRAADTFGQVMIERKQKQDKFNYSMAKQEYLTADLQEREALKDDREYETFDERYRTGLKGHRERITEKYGLTPHDRAIFDAEADLIRERGAAAVGEYGRTIEISDKLSQLEASLAMAREKIQLAEPFTRNDILLTTLDSITALEEDGILTEKEAEQQRQGFVQDVALASLSNMDPEDREKHLEASLAHRKAGGPLSTEDIAAGKGTGSIADFMHTDTATKMLEATKKENELEDTQTSAYAISDFAWEKFPEAVSDSERLSFIREQTRNDPKVRKAALEANRLRQASSIREEALIHQGIMDDMMELIDAGETTGGLPPGPMGKLTAGERATLDKYSQSTHERDGFSDYNDWDAMQEWANMSQAEKAATDLDGYIPTDPTKPNEPQYRWKHLLTRKQMELMLGQKTAAQAAQAAGAVETGLTQTQMLDNYLLSTPYFDHKPVSSDPKEYQDRWSRVYSAYDAQVINEGQEGKLTPTRKREIMQEIMRFEVFVAEDWEADEKFPLAALSEEQIKNAYIPLDQPIGINGQNAYTTWIKIPASDQGPGFSGPAYTWLLNTGKTLSEKNEFPDDELLEQAYFYLVTDGLEAAKRQLSSPEDY